MKNNFDLFTDVAGDSGIEVDTVKRMARVAATILVLGAPLVALAQGTQGQQVSAVDLPPAAARTQRTLGGILGLKQTDDGHVLVNDAVRRQVLRFDRDLANVTVVIDSVPGTSRSYGVVDTLRPNSLRQLMPFVGDSAVFGPQSESGGAIMVVLDSRGTAARVVELGTAGLLLINSGPAFWDSQGRLVYTGAEVGKQFMAKRGDSFGTVSIGSDTISVRRLTGLETRAGAMMTMRNAVFDTLGSFVQPRNLPPDPAGPPMGMRGMGNGGGKLMPATGADGVVCWSSAAAREGPPGCLNGAKQVVNPLYYVDAWAMLSDGTVAFVRGRDYHVDWIAPDGTRSATDKLPFAWHRLTDAEKQGIIDSTRASIDSLDRAAEIDEVKWKPWVDSVTAAAKAAGARLINTEIWHAGPRTRIWPYEIVPATELADYFPAFGPGAAKPDADGNLWILPRTTSLSRRGELVYDVVNPTRGLAQRVRLPLGRSIAGFGTGGVVYLQTGDLKSGFTLEKSVLPNPIPK